MDTSQAFRATGTEVLLCPAEGNGKLSLVENVNRSLYSRDLSRSDDTVRRLQLARIAASNRLRTIGKRGGCNSQTLS